MNFKLPHLFCLILFAFACNKEKAKKIEGLPECVFEEVEENKKTRTENNYEYIIRVIRYKYKEEKVYYVEGINKVIADLDTKIFNEECDVVCLVGGWNTLPECHDFYEKIENRTIVWTE